MNIKAITFIIFLFLLNFNLKAAWCSTSNTVNCGAVVPPDGSAGNASVSTISAASANGKRLFWSFTATSGVRYHFDLCLGTSSDDTYLNLYNSGGTLQTSNDDYIVGYTGSGIDWTCSSSGTYYILATNYNSTTCDVFTNSGTIVLNYFYYGACNPRSLPYSENFSTLGNCWSLPATMNGATTEALWWVNPSNNAGGTSFELIGDSQNNFTGTHTLVATAPALNTTNVLSMQISFRQKLRGGYTSGLPITVSVWSSPNNSTWTQRWTSSTFTSTFPTSNLINATSTTTGTWNPSSNTTYIQFRVVGRLFGLSGWWIDDASAVAIDALPIELMDFHLEPSDDRTINILWETASEKNNDHFTIERSNDGVNFTELKKIKGKLNSTSTQNYNVVDSFPLSGINYYRLKQTDINGEVKNSHVISFEFDKKAKSNLSSIYPNPTNEDVNFDFYTPTKEIINYQVIDFLGRTIYNNEQFIDIGTNTINIDLNSFPSGIYYLKITSNKSNYNSTHKIIKN